MEEIYLYLSDSKVAFTWAEAVADAEIAAVSVSSSDSWHVDTSALPSWLGVSMGRQLENNTIVLTWTGFSILTTESVSLRVYNDGGAEAYLTVVFLAGDYIDATPERVILPAEGGSGAVTVRCSGGGLHMTECGADWLTLVTSGPVGSETLYITAGPYGEGGMRTAEILLTAEETGLSASVEVVQGDTYISVSPSRLDFTNAGGEGRVEVTSSDGTAHVDTSTVPSWISVGQSLTSPMLFALNAEANGAAEEREADVRFYNDLGLQTFAHVHQDGHPEWRVIHAGEFPDIRGTVWRCEISRKDAYETEAMGELSFPADSPLVIEWPSVNFEDPVWGSSATLRVVSPGDRTYIGLYTIEPGTVRLDVYRDGSLWWSGMLDPEFYEEPYERLDGYEVELTFTDFGILDRLKYGLEGTVSVRDVINAAIDAAGIRHALEGEETRFDRSMVALSLGGDASDADSDPFGDAGLMVRSENFTDEEGETASLREALEGVLQPLGLRLAQRAGRVILSDPQGLQDAYGECAEAEWSSDSQTLGVDRVYSGVRVTLSPYVPDEVLPAMTYNDPYSSGWYDTSENNANRYTTAGGQECWTFFPDWSESGGTNYDFTIFKGHDASNITISTGNYAHIEPVYGSAESCDCFAFGFVVGHRSFNSSTSPIVNNYPGAGRDDTRAGDVEYPHVFLPELDYSARQRYYLRFVQELLADCRYNPFTDANSSNERDNQSDLTSNSAFVFIRASVEVLDPSDLSVRCHYDNSLAVTQTKSQYMIFGQWVDGADPGASTWLEYYNPDDLEDNSGGVGGWKANRHCIGKPDGRNNTTAYGAAPAKVRSCDDGEYIPYPPQGGLLRIRLASYLHGYRYGSSYMPDDSGDDSWGDMQYKMRWRLYRGAALSVAVNKGMTFEDADDDDVEYFGTLNEAAADDLEIDTVCGTSDSSSPVSRGLFLRADLSPAGTMWRGGVSGRPESLLIGQLYTQYAGRKTVLTGEAETPSGLMLSERNQEGLRFYLTADSADIRMGVSDIELRECGTDTYREG